MQKLKDQLPPIETVLMVAGSLSLLLFGGALLLMFLFNLTAPLFRSPAMSYLEAVGLTGLYLTIVGTIVALKE